jgi:UDP-N-acetylmuramoylalanine--D-glutamate ligase
MGAFDGEHVVVVGAGVAGSAAARVLLAEGATVRVSDSGRAPGASDLRAEGIEVLEGGHAPDHLDGATMVMTSPGVPPHADILRWANDRMLPVWGELELGARLARVPYLAVTGRTARRPPPACSPHACGRRVWTR